MLTGEKVTLRALKREDMEAVWRFSNDVELELLGGGDPPRPRTLEDHQAWYDEHVAKHKEGEYGFAIEADGKFIGFCGLWRADLAARTVMLGISIGERNYWSRGYGRDAVRLLVDYAFRLLNFRKVWLSTSGDNERAQRCYLASGFIEEGRQRAHLWSNGKYVDQVLMGILREDA
ncbi:MAG TPA: GNAT family protein [Chthonomonadaceae bacterium]|nr:GNAT family protein [Chthonomonadaceae bacterium]